MERVESCTSWAKPFVEFSPLLLNPFQREPPHWHTCNFGTFSREWIVLRIERFWKAPHWVRYYWSLIYLFTTKSILKRLCCDLSVVRIRWRIQRVPNKVCTSSSLTFLHYGVWLFQDSPLFVGPFLLDGSVSCHQKKNDCKLERHTRGCWNCLRSQKVALSVEKHCWCWCRRRIDLGMC